MEELNLSANNAEVAELQNETVEQVEPVQTESVEVVEPQQEKIVQDPQTNAMYAKVRREAEQKAMDKVIAEIYGDQGITSYTAYQEALEKQRAAAEAEKMGIDPAFYQEFSSMKTKLDSIEREKEFIEQDSRLASDPHVGTFYKEWREELMADAKAYNTNLDIALTLKLREKLPEIMTKTMSKAEQATIEKITNNARTSTGALNAGEVSHTTNIKDMSKTDFEALIDRVKRGEKVQI